MKLKQAVKVLLRARSVSFARDYAALGAAANGATAQVAWWCGDGGRVHYRRGTSDTSLAYDILFRPGSHAEYWLPHDLAPRVIFDIGGNVGIASRYLAHRFPQATVHAFEPIPANLELLRRNAANRRIVVHPFGLGGADGEFEFSIPTGVGANPGAYSRFGLEHRSEIVRAPVRATAGVLAALGIGSIDVVKIDTEGAEFDILSSFPREVLSRVAWIYGELHGEDLRAPSGFRTLDLLAEWFDIGVQKSLRKRNFFFDACNKAISGRYGGFRRR